MLVVSYLALQACISFCSISDESGALLCLPCSHKNAAAVAHMFCSDCSILTLSFTYLAYCFPCCFGERPPEGLSQQWHFLDFPCRDSVKGMGIVSQGFTIFRQGLASPSQLLAWPLCRNCWGFLLYKIWRILSGIFLEDFSGDFLTFFLQR